MSWVLIGGIDTSVVGCDHYKATKPQSAGAGENGGRLGCQPVVRACRR